LNYDSNDAITPVAAITHWWQRGVIYQIYPRSFRDANADGIGDLRGVTEKLDYCAGLGVDALWLAPIYPSPMADFGYDVADYTDVAPIFGTLADFDALLAKTTQRGMKVILDFVPNHTSNQHPWFTAARSSRSDPKRDWYLWHDPAPDGGPPNNWLSNFGGSAWEWDAATRQYYYHSFLKEQPDLNWRNPDVVAAMHEVLPAFASMCCGSSLRTISGATIRRIPTTRRACRSFIPSFPCTPPIAPRIRTWWQACARWSMSSTIAS
jgi:glycosidase